MDPRELDAIIVGHLHADHYLDIVPLRYLQPWEGVSGRRIRILLPPGGMERLAALEIAISERAGFFADAFDVAEYATDQPVSIGDLSLRPLSGQHYVPAWGAEIVDHRGHRIVVSGDTGPRESLVDQARDCDLLILEATLKSPDQDDPKRGHLTVDEALDVATRAGAARTLLIHYPFREHAAVAMACTTTPGAVAGWPGLTIDVGKTPGTLEPAGGRSEAVDPTAASA
jgi:ribonuclease BN (tRNA processing enzyme)